MSIPRGISVAAAVVLALSLGACQGHAPSVADAPTATSTATATPSPDAGLIMTDDYRGLANAYDIESPVELGSNDSMPWAINASNEGSLTIFIAYVAGIGSDPECGKHLGTQVVETDTTITITAVGTPRDAQAECAGEPRIEGGSYELAHPLGKRQLLHAPLSTPWDTAPNPLPLKPGPTPDPTPSAVPPVLQDAV